jgi:hypothetical protein
MGYEVDPATLAAKDAIRELVLDYCAAIDRDDIMLLERIYHPDALDEHGYNRSNTAREFLEIARGGAPGMRVLQHNVTNHRVEVAGDEAEGEVYINAYHLIDGGDGTSVLLVGARFLDRYSRREGDWRIAHRRVVIDWAHQFPVGDATGGFEGMDRLQRGTRDAQDPGRAFFRLLAPLRPSLSRAPAS